MLGLLLAAVLIGVLLPVQAGINAQLRVSLGDPVSTALVSFVVGSVGLAAAVVLLRLPLALAGAWSSSHWWHWTGGLLGAVYIAMAVVLAPRLGAASLISAVVGGQMIASLVLDHFGWVGFPERAIDPPRLLGAALVIAGVLLIRR